MARFASGFAFPLGGDPPSTPTQASLIGSEVDVTKEDITLGNRSQQTGRFNFVIGEDGDVSFDGTQAHAVMTSVAERRGGWWADQNHGSDLLKFKSLTFNTPSQAEATVREALKPLEDANMIVIKSVVARARRGLLGRLGVNVSWTTPDGQPFSETVTG